MATFKNLTQIQRHLEKNVHEIMNRSAELERVLADAMSQAVWDVVYAGNEPAVYQNRRDDGGLSDTRNMSITSVTVENNKVKLTFENLTQGNEDFIPLYGHPQDSLHGNFISDTIVEGIKSNWIRQDGNWTDPRDFVSETINKLKSNPDELARAIKNGMAAKGMKVK